jgi:hypothetical protein
MAKKIRGRKRQGPCGSGITNDGLFFLLLLSRFLLKDPKKGAPCKCEAVLGLVLGSARTTSSHTPN